MRSEVILYGTNVDPVPDHLLTFDNSNGNGSIVGSMTCPSCIGALQRVDGLAFDRNSATLYGGTTLSDELVSVNITTGAATQIGVIETSPGNPIAALEALAFDPNTNTLYGYANGSRDLVSINTSTAAATIVGNTGFTNVMGLAFDPNNNILYGAQQVNTGADIDRLITIDTSDGLGTVVGRSAVL